MKSSIEWIPGGSIGAVPPSEKSPVEKKFRTNYSTPPVAISTWLVLTTVQINILFFTHSKRASFLATNGTPRPILWNSHLHSLLRSLWILETTSSSAWWTPLTGAHVLSRATHNSNALSPSRAGATSTTSSTTTAPPCHRWAYHGKWKFFCRVQK